MNAEMLVPHLIAIFIILIAVISFMGGIAGLWGKPIHFSDKVDLFYVEPPKKEEETVQTYRKYPQKAVRAVPTVVRKSSQDNQLHRRKAGTAKVNDRFHQNTQRVQPSVRQDEPRVESALRDECVAILTALGFKPVDAKREVASFSIDHKFKDAQDFLDQYYKGKT